MIYFLDYDPYQCAIDHMDSHLDSAIVTGYRAMCFSHIKRPSFQTHLCASILRPYHSDTDIKFFNWILDSGYNYIWLSRFLFSALHEYNIRFNKSHVLVNKILLLNSVLPGIQFDVRTNDSDSPIWYPLINVDDDCIVYIDSLMVVNAGGDLVLFNTNKQNDFYIEVVSSYRNFYKKKFKDSLNYSDKSKIPLWL